MSMYIGVSSKLNIMQWVGQMDLDVSDIVQPIKQSMFWMVHASHIRLDSLCGILSSKYPCIGVSSKLNIMQWVGQMDLDVSDIVQQIKQSIYKSVWIMLDLLDSIRQVYITYVQVHFGLPAQIQF